MFDEFDQYFPEPQFSGQGFRPPVPTREESRYQQIREIPVIGEMAADVHEGLLTTPRQRTRAAQEFAQRVLEKNRNNPALETYLNTQFMDDVEMDRLNPSEFVDKLRRDVPALAAGQQLRQFQYRSGWGQQAALQNMQFQQQQKLFGLQGDLQRELADINVGGQERLMEMQGGLQERLLGQQLQGQMDIATLADQTARYGIDIGAETARLDREALMQQAQMSDRLSRDAMMIDWVKGQQDRGFQRENMQRQEALARQSMAMDQGNVAWQSAAKFGFR